PDVILAHGSSTVGPLLQATRTVPIVFPIAADPVGAGFVDSLARPGGNVTGFMEFEYSQSGKWLELLKEIVPGMTRAAVLRDTSQGSATSQFAAIRAVAPSLKVEVNAIRLARHRRDRARCRGLRAISERWSDRDGRRRDGASCQSDRHAGGPAQAARGLQRTLVRRGRRSDLLWARFRRPVPPRSRLC